MKTTRLRQDRVRVETTSYALELRADENLGLLTAPGTHVRCMFFPGGAVNTMASRDETTSMGRPQVAKRGGACVITIAQASTVWKSRTATFVCREKSVEFFLTVEGHGDVDRALFLRGYLNGQERGFAGDFDEIINTAPNFYERRRYHPSDFFFISHGNNLTTSACGQALASPCCCMGLHDRRDKRCVSVGLAATPGAWTWDAMEWNAPAAIPATPHTPDNMLCGGFSAAWEGKLRVDGQWQSPRLVLTVARSEEDTLPAYLRHAFEHGYLPKPSRRKPEAWWQEPIYCTWHDQVGMSHATGTPVFELCAQELTDRWVNLLEKNRCKPGIVILDATWQVHLNTAEPDKKKWPDFRAWVDRCHERGIRVFVWSAAWAKDGLPLDECILRDGQPVACDITNPKYEERFRSMVRTWFSSAPGCLNADGVKMDGLLSVPTGKGLSNHANLWGLELQRRYCDILWDEAKKAKPDACVSTFVANPYLADSSDMVRIADMYTSRLTAHETMLWRAEVYRQTMPYAVVDTDGQFSHYNVDGYASELAEQAKVGVPTLYCAEWVYRHRFFQPARITKMAPADYREFARVFAAHRKRIRKA